MNAVDNHGVDLLWGEFEGPTGNFMGNTELQSAEGFSIEAWNEILEVKLDQTEEFWNVLV